MSDHVRNFEGVFSARLHVREAHAVVPHQVSGNTVAALFDQGDEQD
ncbi:hypothetical protein ICM05_09885 [Leucobacter sp. cx-42]|nr:MULTISPECIES: hypothetical protein [unclassified Leucobacter]MBC9954947.1 hypothetical protein [Leucobacter sp. cx-42]